MYNANSGETKVSGEEFGKGVKYMHNVLQGSKIELSKVLCSGMGSSSAV